MKEITFFDRIGRLQLRAVKQADVDIARFCLPLPSSQLQLHEVWVIPEKEQYFTAIDLHEMHMSDFSKIIDIYDPELSAAPIHAISKQIDLLETFAGNVVIDDARFRYSLVSLATGTVLSIVFGHRKAMPRKTTRTQMCAY